MPWSSILRRYPGVTFGYLAGYSCSRGEAEVQSCIEVMQAGGIHKVCGKVYNGVRNQVESLIGCWKEVQSRLVARQSSIESVSFAQVEVFIASQTSRVKSDGIVRLKSCFGVFLCIILVLKV